MSDLYDADVLEWSGHQTALLRRIAAGEPVNEALDWAHIIEEVADVGRSQLRACESLLFEALLHDLKAEAWPQSRDAEHWRMEARVARVNAARAVTPSMRQHIDVAKLHAEAVSVLPATIDGQPQSAIATICPVTLDDMLRGA